MREPSPLRSQSAVREGQEREEREEREEGQDVRLVLQKFGEPLVARVRNCCLLENSGCIGGGGRSTRLGPNMLVVWRDRMW